MDVSTIVLVVLSILLGFIGSIAGVGGGVLFTPIFLAFSSLHVDVVRATGLAVAITTSVVASRSYIRAGIAPLKLALLFSAVAALAAVGGAATSIYMVKSLGKTGEAWIRIALALVMFLVVAVMFLKRKDYPEPVRNPAAERLGLVGSFIDPVSGREVVYMPNRLFLSALLIAGVGFISGAFGLGGGWAMVAVLNLVTNIPLRVATATSLTIIAIIDTSALWVYMGEGTLHPHLVALTSPAVVIGAMLGARTAMRLRAAVIRYVVIGVMLFSAIYLLQRGLSQLL